MTEIGVTVRVVDGGAWETPLTRQPLATVRGARLARSDYDRDAYYALENVGGYFAYYVAGAPLRVTSLEVMTDGEWMEWMIDDPLHWYGMGERVEDLNPGRVLVAGLGLGLMLHHMSERDDLTEITVVERSQDVIDLVSPTLPRDPRVSVVCDDYYSYLTRHYGVGARRLPHSVLWDLAVGSGEHTRAQIDRGIYLTKRALPTVDLFCFGLRGRGPT